MTLTLGQAARLAGMSKTTLTRAIKAGRLSASRRDDGSYAIDPAELERVYTLQPSPPATPATSHSDSRAVHHATPSATATATPPTPDVAMATRMSAMEAELRGLKDMVTELRQSRDQWQQQAERVTLALSGPERVRQPWWRRLTG